jgi:ABC-type sugar transport system substrate-binding protein
MIDKVPVVPSTPGPIRLQVAYRSAGSLLRALSRALSQGQTLLQADSGLPAGTRIVLVMTAAAVSAPIEVQGVVTACLDQDPFNQGYAPVVSAFNKLVANVNPKEINWFEGDVATPQNVAQKIPQ